MPASRTLSVVIAGDAAGARRAFQETETSATGVQSKLKKVGAGLASIGQAAALSLGTVAVGFGSMAIKAALEGEQAQARLTNAVKNAGPAFKNMGKIADGLNDKYAKWGFENDEVQISLSKLVPVTKNSADATKKLALAADIAKARHLSLEDATALLVKVQTGHVGLLGRLGIATKDATGKTISQEEAIKKLTDLYGGQADRSAGTYAGKMQALKAQFHNLSEEIGQVLLPILAAVIGFLVDHKEILIGLGVLVGTVLVAAFTAWAVSLFTAGGALAFLLSPVALVIAALVAIVAAAVFVWTHWDQIWTWIKDHPAYAVILAILAAPIAAFVLIIGGLKWLYDNWDSIWSAVQSVLQVAWDTVIHPIFDAIGWGFVAVVAAANSVRGIWDGIFDGLSTAWNAVGKPVLDAVIFAVGIAVDLYQTLSDFFGSITDPAKRTLTPNAGGYIDPTRTRASGGPVGPGQWLVGENGPELLTLGMGARGHVTNAKDTQAMGGGRTSNSTYNINVVAPSPTVAVGELMRRLRAKERAESL